MVEIFAKNISRPLSAGEKKKIAAILSDEQLKKAARFKRRKDAEVSLWSSFFSRQILSRFVGVEPEELVFSANKYGRPGLAFPKVKNLDFNIAHSGDWLVMAVGDSQVGIDIEKIRPLETDIAKGFFTAREFDYINKDPCQQNARFFEIWTLKESFVKAIGKGLIYPLKNIEFSVVGSQKISAKIKGGQQWHFKGYGLDPSYKLAACSQKNNFPKSVKILNNNTRFRQLILSPENDRKTE